LFFLQNFDRNHEKAIFDHSRGNFEPNHHREVKKRPRAVIIGLDAATWTLTPPWIAEGGMPNLAKLMKAGVSGTLQSVLPPITPPAWTSFMTGKNPGKNGIFHFVETERAVLQ
jgi:predicted AlkP superfamily phosphohydrolase/phosphomutase